ncbi:MAG: class I SAM-dependent methyltransferase [Bacteroidota bacterium]
MAADVGKGFDRLAAIYDGLARAVYGKSIRRAQLHFLDQWPKGATVLIVGGGTGWFLEAVLRKTDPRKVYYIELSEKMLEKSAALIREQLPAALPRVEFRRGTVHDQAPPAPVDIVVTHFYLDLFNGAELRGEIATLDAHLRPGGYWSLADFAYVERGIMRPVARFLVAGMYFFFRLAAGIRSRKLEVYPDHLAKSGLIPQAEARYYGGMIRASWHRKE